jgi:acyl transferase domain-containing protein/acyl carrier protein
MNSENIQPMIAIIGMSGRFPKAPDLDAFWNNLKHGIEGITFFSDAELLARGVPAARIKAPNFVKAAPVLTGIDQFDASFFGYVPSDARLLDPQQRLFLETTWHALEHASVDPSTYPGAIGVFGGASLSTYLLFNVLNNPGYSDHENGFEAMVNNDKDFLCTRVAYHFDLRGPSLAVQTGCSTSLVAMHLACEALISFQCDVALAGAVSVNVPQRTGYLYEKDGIASPDGHCRALDAKGQGTVFGSGVGVVVLKRLEDALEDSDTIHAVILSSAINNDGAHKIGFTAPSVDGQAEVILRARTLANIPASSISYVEAHGTATSLGDPIEIAALSQAFRVDTDAKQFCAVGSVKSNIGHLDAAAGMAGLIKTVMALEHEEIPPTLHFTAPNPAINFAQSPFYVNDVCRPWPRTDQPRRAGVSSFGIGGTNAHTILQEAPLLPATTAPQRPHALLLLSARTERALEATTERLHRHLIDHPEVDLSDVAFTLQRGRKRFEWRRALACRDRSEARTLLESKPADRLFTTRSEHRDRPVAFVFPGDVSAGLKMPRELYDAEPVFRTAMDACAELLAPQLGHDVRQVEHGLTLPALISLQYALAQQLLSWGLKPAAMIGRGLGEIAAACVAGGISLEDALRMVVKYARLSAAGAAATEITRELVAWLQTVALRAPTVPVVSSVTGTFIMGEQATDPRYWGERLLAAVQSQAGAPKLVAQGHVLVEIGPRSTPGNGSEVVPTMAGASEVLSADRFLLEMLGKLWALGVTPDWQAFHGDERRRRIPLPGYPFERQSYWIEPHVAATQQPSAPRRQANMADWFHAPMWQPTAAPAFRSDKFAAGACWLVFANADDLSQQVIDTLERNHQRVIRVDASDHFSAAPQRYELQAGSARDHEQLVRDLRQAGQRLDHVLHLWSLRDTADFATAQRHGFNALIHLARAWDRTWTEPVSWWVVGRRLHRISAEDSIDPNQATQIGPCRVIPQEYPHISCYSVDVGAPAANTAQLLLADVLAAPEDRVLAYRGAQRWRQTFQPAAMIEPAPTDRLLRAEGVYVITGGLGAVGLHWAAHLARSYQAKLVLLARSAFPERHTWTQHLATETPLSRTIRQVQELEAAGAEVLISTADVGSEAQLRAAVGHARKRFGRINGIIHAAGVAGSKAIKALADFEPTEREAQFVAKVHGTYNLGRIAPDLDLDFVLLVSSTAAIFGGVGLTTYAAANAFLDAFVTSGQARGTRWFSVNFDHLRTGGNTGASGIKTVDEYALEPGESVEVFQRVVTRSSSPHVIVSATDLTARWQRWIVHAGKQDAAQHTARPSSATLHPRPELETAYLAPGTPHEQRIAEIWQQILGIEQIGVNDNFFTLGGDSLLAVRVTSKLRKELDVDIPVSRLYEGLTVRALAAIVGELIQPPTAESPASAEGGDRQQRHAERHDRLQQLRARRRISSAE